MITRHLLIRGRVQGVGFRNYMAYKANELGIHGWVRNRRNGSVEAVVQGAPDAVSAIIECAHRGPRAALMSGVEVRSVDAHQQVDETTEQNTGTYTAFEMRSTV